MFFISGTNAQSILFTYENQRFTIYNILGREREKKMPKDGTVTLMMKTRCLEIVCPCDPNEEWPLTLAEGDFIIFYQAEKGDSEMNACHLIIDMKYEGMKGANRKKNCISLCKH